ncbi:MAG: hypothetical protein ABSA49_02895 [Rhizomicrobium sp.]|jgi:uncharacterized membrane protein
MIPLWMSIAVCGERRRFFRLWLPLFLLWLLLLPFAILALPVLAVLWLAGGRCALAKPIALWQMFASLRGTLIDIDHPDGSVFIRIV